MGREIGAQFFRVRAESVGDPGKDGHGIGVIEGKADHGHSDVRLPAVKGRVDFPWLVHPEQARTPLPSCRPSQENLCLHARLSRADLTAGRVPPRDQFRWK
ncbi:hypothetical protein SAMN05446589_4908 [Streptomyces sp. OV198]|jgi:hypothetical protein|nr:hypothetical protein SAMN05446589_4908 [Streptomyces sp. OV198]